MKLTVSRFSSHPPRLGEGMTIAGRFKLNRQIGEGGMGSVWLATHLGLGIPCAIKFVEGEWKRQPEMVTRLEREAKVEAQLRSPHVVHVLDHGIWNGTPYIAMEYLQGETVAQRLERVRRLDYTATHRLVAHVARALTRAHAVGIVHRDLKPENIYLIPDDDGEMAKVLDFGVAKYSTDWAVNSVTKTGLLVGTPLYMSPEQARGTKELDHRADLWSLAVIAYQCLTGELPFVSEGLGDLLAKIMFEPIPVPSHIVPTLPPAFDAWWARASSRDIHVRFTSAKEIADTLGVALGLSTSVTVAAAPPGFREKTMSDYSLSVSDSAGPVSERGGIAKFWPRGQTGRLLGLGVVGVIAIAGTMSWKSARDKRSSETLVTPSAPVSAASASPDLLPPVNPVIAPGGENPDSEPAKMAEPAIEPPPAARPAPKEPSRSSPSKRAVPAPAAPAKPKRVDFGI